MRASKAITEYHIPEIVKELVAAGVIPSECRRFELVMEPCAVVKIRCEVSATREQVQAIADALIRNPEEAKSIVKLIAYPRHESEEVAPSVTVEL